MTPTPSLLPTTTYFEVTGPSVKEAWSNGDTGAVVAAKANAHKLLTPLFDYIKLGTKGDFTNFYGIKDTDEIEWRAVAGDAAISVTTVATSAGDGYKNYNIEIKWSVRDTSDSIAASSSFEWKNVPVQKFTKDVSRLRRSECH